MPLLAPLVLAPLVLRTFWWGTLGSLNLAVWVVDRVVLGRHLESDAAR